jgi:hypothetical protein
MAGTVALPGITPVTALGDGYDSFAFTARSTALAPVTKRSGGTKTWFSYYKCKTVKKLLESINVSASISGSYGFVDEVSEKASYFHSLLTTSNFVSVVVYVAKTELLVPEKVELAVTPDERDFFKWYGDSYASSIQLGGELIATYIFYCQTEEEVEAVSDQLKVCGIDEDGALDASFEANMSRAQSEIDVTQSMRTYLAGYVDMDKPPPTTAGLFDYATKVFSTEPNDPVTVNYTVEGYEHVPGFNAPWFDAVVANRRLLNDGVGRERSLKESRMLLSQRKNDIESVKTVYRRYGITPVDAEEIAAHEREIDDDVSTLEDTLAYIDADPTREVGPPDLPSLQWKPARLELEQVDVGPWGGNGGDPFDDVDIGLARHAMRPPRSQSRRGGRDRQPHPARRWWRRAEQRALHPRGCSRTEDLRAGGLVRKLAGVALPAARVRGPTGLLLAARTQQRPGLPLRAAQQRGADRLQRTIGQAPGSPCPRRGSLPPDPLGEGVGR